ncbi:MAG TPA: NAD(P)-dependent oxidoreductase [Candidatus Acidoferrales bacterium]|jgi:3-hydroxyisobutyrate dehydrogenase-like beta-hydroxyacid dehydrogenase|nr:NAD(P)-dependent oxidoreductase [Candidatus Acidoferrales bacterium]
MTETLGFIGLGNMGEPIAANLLAAGHALRIYNRTASKAAPLVAKGATLAKHSAEVVASPGGVVFTMVADDRAIEELCLSPGSFVEKLGPGGIHVSLSTISPATARRLAEHHARHKVEYVASPVFGRPEAAAAKKLWVCTSGHAAPKARVHPLLEAIGQGIFDFGEDAGAANVVKLCGNFMIASAIETISESLALAEKNGIDKNVVADLFGKTLFACPIYQGYGKSIAAEKFEPAGFRLALGFKDVSLALATATASEVPLPVASLLHDRYLAAIAKGRGDMDWTAVALGVSEDAGINPQSQTKTAR